MNKATLTARRLITDVGVIEYPVIDVGPDGRITEIASDASVRSDETLTATFLDVHTHGAAGHDLMESTPEGMEAVNHFLASRGVGQYLPTTVTAPVDATLRAVERFATAIERGAGEDNAAARPIGVHLEGPFLSHGKRGVHLAEFLQPPSVELFERFREASRGTVRLITIAPEVPGAMELIAHAVAVGVRVSIGHTEATAAQARAAVDAGARSATHTFNAMRALDHREPGTVGLVLDDERLFAEMICDGVHVAPEAIRLWLRSKGTERAILITDGLAAAGMPDGHYRLGGMELIVSGGICRANGVLAGSVLTMDRAVANIQRITGVALDSAVRMASHTPAAMLGAPELTRITIGARADLNRFSPDGRLVATYLGGRQAELA